MAATVVYARSRPRIAYVEEWRALDLFGDSRLVPAMRHRSHPPSLDRRAVTRHQMSHQTAASPVSRSVPGFKRDDDVRCFRLVKLETSRVVVAPAGKASASQPSCARSRVLSHDDVSRGGGDSYGGAQLMCRRGRGHQAAYP